MSIEIFIVSFILYYGVNLLLVKYFLKKRELKTREEMQKKANKIADEINKLDEKFSRIIRGTSLINQLFRIRQTTIGNKIILHIYKNDESYELLRVEGVLVNVTVGIGSCIVIKYGNKVIRIVPDQIAKIKVYENIFVVNYHDTNKYLKILGLKSGFTRMELTSTYRKLSKEHHPDRYRDVSESVRQEHENIFKEISEAYAYCKKLVRN